MCRDFFDAPAPAPGARPIYCVPTSPARPDLISLSPSRAAPEGEVGSDPFAAPPAADADFGGGLLDASDTPPAYDVAEDLMGGGNPPPVSEPAGDFGFGVEGDVAATPA